MINKKLKKPLRISLTIGELFEHFGLTHKEQWGRYHTKNGNWDMDKIDELLDIHVTHKVEEAHGEGWMTDEANLGVTIKFEVEVDSIVSYEEGEDRKLITTDDEMAEA
tara:strand:- start:88 stop:411 length:324 start_codon:yes stop_codon:yes gene_type:complete